MEIKSRLNDSSSKINMFEEWLTAKIDHYIYQDPGSPKDIETEKNFVHQFYYKL